MIEKCKNIFLTGKPGIGKTTAIKRVIELLKLNKIPVSGFFSEEERDKSGQRIGFLIKTISGETATLASCVQKMSGPKVGKYTVNLKGIDECAVPSMEKSEGIIIVDEIGKMEMFSKKFNETILKILYKGCVIGTIMEKPNDFADKIKKRDDVKIIQITLSNRNKIPEEIIKEILANK